MDFGTIRKINSFIRFFLETRSIHATGKQPRNDLDNLSKPILDALVEIGIFEDDSGILDLTLRKRKSNTEGVRIQIRPFLQDDHSFD